MHALCLRGTVGQTARDELAVARSQVRIYRTRAAHFRRHHSLNIFFYNVHRAPYMNVPGIPLLGIILLRLVLRGDMRRGYYDTTAVTHRLDTEAPFSLGSRP